MAVFMKEIEGEIEGGLGVMYRRLQRQERRFKAKKTGGWKESTAEDNVGERRRRTHRCTCAGCAVQSSPGSSIASLSTGVLCLSQYQNPVAA
eukprot:1164661-Rhodomonas_salina.1